MAQSSVETPVTGAVPPSNRATRDRPQASETTSDPPSPKRLDWEGFVAARFPGSRRHDLKAIVAYATYRHSLLADGPATPAAFHSSASEGSATAASLEEWEDDGGRSS